MEPESEAESTSRPVAADSSDESVMSLVRRLRDHRGYKMVNYAGLIAPLIEAVKELDARIMALEKVREMHGR